MAYQLPPLQHLRKYSAVLPVCWRYILYSRAQLPNYASSDALLQC